MAQMLWELAVQSWKPVQSLEELDIRKKKIDFTKLLCNFSHGHYSTHCPLSVIHTHLHPYNLIIKMSMSFISFFECSL